jgi:hypothetical protein
MLHYKIAKLSPRYGATSFPSVPWIFPAIAVAVVTFGAYAIYLSVFTYFADV